MFIKVTIPGYTVRGYQTDREIAVPDQKMLIKVTNIETVHDYVDFIDDTVMPTDNPSKSSIFISNRGTPVQVIETLEEIEDMIRNAQINALSTEDV